MNDGGGNPGGLRSLPYPTQTVSVAASSLSPPASQPCTSTEHSNPRASLAQRLMSWMPLIKSAERGDHKVDLGKNKRVERGGLQNRAVSTCTIWAVVVWASVKMTLGCSVLQCPSSSPWEVKSSPQSPQVKVLCACLKCSVVTWCCRAPGKQKEAELYKQ